MRSKKFRLILVIFWFFTFLFVGEIVVRFKGYHGGSSASSVFAFKEVDTLINYNYFFADSNGLQVADQKWFNEIPLTKDGFVKPVFSKQDTVMYVGDSFLWGAGASSPNKSFFHLLSNGYNFGIPGADPAQYSKIIDLYIEKCNGKNVVVCFYMGNDIMKEDREVSPYCELFYETNAGMFSGCYKGEYVSLKNSYQRSCEYFSVNQSNLFGKIISKSALLTVLFKAVPQWIDIKRQYDKGNYALVNAYLAHMQEKCLENNKRMIVCIIPSTNDLRIKKQYLPIFTTIESVYWPKDILEQTDFDKTSHFSDSGQKKFANFIQQCLKTAPKNDFSNL